MIRKKVAIYVRTSNVPAAPALQRQISELQQLAQRLGCARPCIVADLAHGGAVKSEATNHQAGFAELSAACERGEVDTILVTSPDRLTRCQAKLGEILAWADDQRVQLISLGGRIS